MTAEKLLKHNIGKVLTLTSSGGDIVIAKILGIDDEYGEVVCELVSSTQPERYPSTSGVQFVMSLAEIRSVTCGCGRGPLSKRRPSSRWRGSRAVRSPYAA
jgi:hypothetical protein